MPRTAAWHAAATAVIWLTSLFVVALWVAGGGVTATLGFNAETLTTIGRLTGLVSANLLLYQVLLMARIPIFERGFGRDSITRMHRFVGFWSFWLMGAHIVLLVLGYAATAASTRSCSCGSSSGTTPACCSRPSARCSSCSS